EKAETRDLFERAVHGQGAQVLTGKDGDLDGDIVESLLGPGGGDGDGGGQRGKVDCYIEPGGFSRSELHHSFQRIESFRLHTHTVRPGRQGGEPESAFRVGIGFFGRLAPPVEQPYPGPGNGMAFGGRDPAFYGPGYFSRFITLRAAQTLSAGAGSERRQEEEEERQSRAAGPGRTCFAPLKAR
ncbi:MAG: hypothetical protein O6850_00935, partial [Acidobacteria bacterium]|nr:hypothetical protein [Acidobacteriota bacterium]